MDQSGCFVQSPAPYLKPWALPIIKVSAHPLLMTQTAEPVSRSGTVALRKCEVIGSIWYNAVVCRSSREAEINEIGVEREAETQDVPTENDPPGHTKQ